MKFEIFDPLNNQKITPIISADNTIGFLKKSLFYTNPNFYPHFIRFENCHNDENYICDKLKDGILNLYHIASEILEDKDVDIDFLAKSPYVLETVFKNYEDLYINLTLEDFTFLINRLSEEDSPEADVYFDNLEIYQREIVDSLKKTFENKVYKKIIESTNNFDLNDKYSIRTSFSNMSFLVDTNWKSTITNDIIFKLFDTFNFLETNDDIPVIALNKKYSSSKMPLIKVYDNFLKTNENPDKLFKNWFISERKMESVVKYKSVKGLILKKKIYELSRYLNINILASGYITASLEGDFDITKENLKIIVNNIQSVFNILNSKSKNIFTEKTFVLKLDKISILNSDIIYFIDNNLFNINKFKKIINNQFISETFFKLKDTKYEDIISFQYTNPFGEFKNYTINLQNEKYTQNGMIKIFDINNKTLGKVISEHILSIYNKNDESDNLEDIKIKEKSHKKILAEEGVFFDPKKCQGLRQPHLLKLGEKSSKQVLNHKNKDFICANKEYPFIGFTENNTVCCFKKSQEGVENYIRNINPKSLEIQVQPSNYKVKINKILQNAIKLDDDYYILNNKNLVKIEDFDVIKELDSVNPWLEQVPLANLIYKVTQNKCSKWPDTTKLGDKACAEHTGHKNFGYSKDSLPCCYVKEKIYDKDEGESLKNKKKIYIITDQKKILGFNKLGLLPDMLQNILNHIVPENKFYRLGSLQNENSLLNSLSSSLGISTKLIRETLVNFLKSDPKIFYTLENGIVGEKWQYDDYIKYLETPSEKIYISDFVDLIQIAFKINIFILDYDNVSGDVKIFCKRKNKRDVVFKNNILVLRINDTYNELIVKLNNESDTIKSIFDSDDKIITFFNEYYKDSCVVSDIYPKNFPYLPLPIAKTVIDNIKIKYQIANEFNKIEYLMTTKNELIPIQETTLIRDTNIEILFFKDLISKNLLQKYSKVQKSLTDLSEKMDISKIEIIETAATEYPDIIAALTNRGVFIPVINDAGIIPRLKYIHYFDANTIISSENLLENDNFKAYSDFNKTLAQLTTILKRSIGKIEESDKQNVLGIIKTTNKSKYSKILEIKTVLEKYTSSFKNDKYYDLAIKSIINEIINDNVENLVLNNIFIPSSYTRGAIINRKNESVLLNMIDIKNWLSKFTI